MVLSSKEREIVNRIVYEDEIITTDLKPVTLIEKVETIRPLLYDLADKEETSSYIEVTNDFNLVHSTRIGTVLGIIGLLEHEQGNPWLPAVVVRATSDWPGPGFLNLLRLGGEPVPSTEAEQKELWREHLEKVYNHDW